LKLLSWNVNGIRAIAKKGFVEWVNSERPDILCLQETKAWEEQLDKGLKQINGYTSFFSKAERKGYSGVATYTLPKPLEIKDELGVEEFDKEGRILVLRYNEFILFNVYFPNGKQNEIRLKYKLDFYEAFFEKVNELKEKGEKIVICGDVNTAHKEIDLARPKENSKVSGFLPVERAWIDKLLQAGFIDTLRMFNSNKELYTWWDFKTRARERNVGWRIDYFFISENLKGNITNAFIMPEVTGSDHCPIGIELQFKNQKEI
jgi:exodeoxyribonuclease-3